MVVHVPVLLQEVVEHLNIKPDGFYVDCTVGEGGHAKEVLSLLGGKGYLVGIDANEDIFTSTRKNLDKYQNYSLVHSHFSQINSAVTPLLKFQKRSGVDGILLDVGYSSWLLEKSERGFSYKLDESLDLRYDTSSGRPASEQLKHMGLGEIRELLEVGGLTSVRLRDRLAENIFKSRKNIQSTSDLLELIHQSSHRDKASHKLVSLVFQSIRIHVNDEFNELKKAVQDSVEILNPQGRLVVICFHSGEDRIVKLLFKDFMQKGEINILTAKPVKASRDEYTKNPRSRSALLRACEKI